MRAIWAPPKSRRESPGPPPPSMRLFVIASTPSSGPGDLNKERDRLRRIVVRRIHNL